MKFIKRLLFIPSLLYLTITLVWINGMVIRYLSYLEINKIVIIFYNAVSTYTTILIIALLLYWILFGGDDKKENGTV